MRLRDIPAFCVAVILGVVYWVYADLLTNEGREMDLDEAMGEE